MHVRCDNDIHVAGSSLQSSSVCTWPGGLGVCLRRRRARRQAPSAQDLPAVTGETIASAAPRASAVTPSERQPALSSTSRHQKKSLPTFSAERLRFAPLSKRHFL